MDHPIRLAEQLRVHLRALRLRQGLTQTQLGKRLGLGQVRIAEIEARPGAISVDQLVSILSALGATLVLRDAADGKPAPRGASPASPRDGRAPSRPKAKKGVW